jgi:hypothetical protein
MKYELKAVEVGLDEEVEIPDGAFLPNLSEPNEFGVCELTYLAPVRDEA